MASRQLTQDGEHSQVTCYHSVQSTKQLLCQLQPQRRGPVKGRFQPFAEALA